jgi:hypothetical protein
LKQIMQTSTAERKKSPLSVWLLQFFHAYLDHNFDNISDENIINKSNKQNDSNNTFKNEIATCLSNFFKDCLSSSIITSHLSPACYFQLFRILHDSVSNFPILVDEKKYAKDTQETTHKLFELCNSIVALSLQQTTWLRKNYAVKLTPLPSTIIGNSSQALNSGINLNVVPSNQSVNFNNMNNESITSPTVIGNAPSLSSGYSINNESTVSTNINSSNTANELIKTKGNQIILNSNGDDKNSKARSLHFNETNVISDIENGKLFEFYTLN